MRYVLMMAALAAATGPVVAQDGHKVFDPDAIEWGPGPATLPPGAEASVLYGNPAEDGLFALRLKFPPGYHIPAHLHPKPEVVTVISGAVKLGSGEKADPDAGETITAGGLFTMPPEMAHYLYTDQEAVVQLNSVGPFTVTYIDPADDPRKTQ